MTIRGKEIKLSDVSQTLVSDDTRAVVALGFFVAYLSTLLL